MDNEKIKQLRSSFKNVIEASREFASVKEDFDRAVLTSFLISSPEMQSHEDDMKVVLAWARKMAGNHSTLSLFLMGLITVAVEDGKVMCKLVDPERSASCWDGEEAAAQ